MNVLSAVSLFSVLLYLAIGIYTFNRDRSAKLNRLFFLWCLSMTVWSFGYAWVYVTGDYQYIWMKVSAFGWCTFSAILLHLALLFTESRWIQRPFVKVIIYLPAVVFLYMSVFLFSPGRALPKAVEDFFYTGDFLYDFSYLLFSIAIVFRWGRKSESRKNKKQAKVIVACSLTPFLLNLLTQNLLPLWGIQAVPLMGHIYMLIMLFGMYYSIRYYRLFDITPQMLNDHVFAEMMDLGILLSPEGVILKVSNSTETLLQYNPGELIGKPLRTIIQDQPIHTGILDSKITSTVCRYTEIHCVAKSGDLLPVSISCSSVIDPYMGEVVGIVLVGHDIRITKELELEMQAHKIMAEQLKESEERFRAMFSKHTAVMYLIELESLYIFDVNEAAKKYYGYSEDVFRRKKITELNGLTEEEERQIFQQIKEQKADAFYFRHQLASGEWRDVEVHATVIRVRDKELVFSIVSDITDKKKAQEYISFLAYHDFLTGLPNRKSFYERLRQEMERAKRKQEKLAVLFLDLDDFKVINDSYGHEVGDMLLREVTTRAGKAIRETDMIARMGGDEFTFLILDVTGIYDVEVVIHRILEELSTPVMIGRQFISIQASIGVGLFPDDGESAEILINKADNAMYAVKNRKKAI